VSYSIQAQFNNIFYDNEVYVDYIESVQFSHSGLTLSIPIIDLRGGQLFLEFDDREGEYKNYTYHLIHCDKDWNPSPLDEIEYLDGFNGEEIDEFAYSVNGYSEYTHYELTLPNEDIRWTISGNYLLSIYDQDLEITVLTRRFIVAESSANIFGEITRPDNTDKRNTHHELKLAISYEGMRVRRPQEEIFLTIMQNGNTNGALHNLTGTYVRGNNLHFDQYDMITFPALKEFRSCDVRNLKFRTEFVHSIDQKDGVTTVLMDLGKKRNDRVFLTEPDANGGFIIENKDAREGDISSEYVEVIFSLEADQPYEQDVYLTGAFSDWQPKDKYLMEYDSFDRLYTKTLILKQGYYDYMFALRTAENVLDMDPLEGSWYETENEYYVIAYYRDFGGEYDRVIAAATLTSTFMN